MHPFWNNVVEYFPKWIAPNVLTFLGFLFTVLNFILLSFYDWDYYANSDKPGTTPVPDWLWIVAAFNIFLAYTLGGDGGHWGSVAGPFTYSFLFQMALMESKQDVLVCLVPWENYSIMDWTLIPPP